MIDIVAIGSKYDNDDGGGGTAIRFLYSNSLIFIATKAVLFFWT